MHTSISNIYLNLSLNFNDLITYNMSNTFVSFPICLMIPDIHLQRFLCIQWKSGLGLCTCQAWRPLVYLSGGLCFSHQCPDIVIEDEADVRTREKVELCLEKLLSTPPPRGTQGWYTSRLNKWVICLKINHLNYMYLSK